MRARRPPTRHGARGAALLAALLTVAFIATLASAGLWQQWRSVEVETAERARLQARWILTGALDWGRLILREDARAGAVDHLAEPWAVPLQEARLSSFLAADREAGTDGKDVDNAFLSGEIADLQGRLNVMNLLDGNQVSPGGMQSFQRLFDALGLPLAQLDLLAQNLRLATGTTDPAEANGLAPLMPRRARDLGWLGLPPATVAALEPHVTVLPIRTPVNLNTASAQVIQAAIGGIGLADAQRLVSARASAHFRTVADATRLLGQGGQGPPTQVAGAFVGVASRFFEIRGRLRLDDTVVEEYSIVQREGLEVRALQRDHAVLTAGVPGSGTPGRR